jgi:hypothetical protein
VSSDAFGAISLAGAAVTVEPQQQLLSAVIQVEPAAGELLSDAVQARQIPLDLSSEVAASFDFIIAVRETAVAHLRCEVSVFLGPLLLAVLSPMVVVSEQQSQDIEVVPAAIDRVFASYSRRDAQIVDGIEMAARALGVDLFVDRRNLRTGDDWKRRVQQELGRVDAFQLFWSHASATSQSVEWEWNAAMRQYATLRQRRRALAAESRSLKDPIRFIRPVRWERDTPPLPAELQQFNMVYLPQLSLG